MRHPLLPSRRGLGGGITMGVVVFYVSIYVIIFKIGGDVKIRACYAPTAGGTLWWLHVILHFA